MSQKIYSNTKRDVIATKFRIGQTVKYKGKDYKIRVIDAWTQDEIYLAIDRPEYNGSFNVITSKELDGGNYD